MPTPIWATVNLPELIKIWFGRLWFILSCVKDLSVYHRAQKHKAPAPRIPELRENHGLHPIRDMARLLGPPPVGGQFVAVFRNIAKIRAIVVAGEHMASKRPQSRTKSSGLVPGRYLTVFI